MKKTILAGVIGLTTISAFTSTQVLADDYYFRYPVSISINDTSGGNNSGEGNGEGSNDECNEGYVEQEDECVLDFNKEESKSVWREFANKNSISKDHRDGEFHIFKKFRLGEGVTSLPSALYPLDITSSSIILENSGLTDVDSLESIKYIGGGLHLDSNKISNIFGLSNLTQVRGSLMLSRNDIPNTTALSNLVNVGDELSLYDNDIADTNGLSNLVTVETINLNKNPRLTSISLPSLSGDIRRISFPDNVKEFSAPNLNHINNLTRRSSNSFVHGALEKVVLPKLNHTGEGVYLGRNNISELDLSSITDVKTLSLKENNLEDLSGIRNLKTATNGIFSENNIKTIDDLSRLEKVDKKLTLYDNDIADTNGLSNLVTVGSIDIRKNPRLTSISLPSLSGDVDTIKFSDTVKEIIIPSATTIDNLSSGSYYSYFNNGDLERVVLPSLNNKGDDIHLRNNQISDLVLSSVVNVDEINISGNNLEDLSGISNLSIANKVDVEDNPLQNLNGIANLSSGELYIKSYNGDSLPSGSVFCTSADTYLFIDGNSTPKSNICS